MFEGVELKHMVTPKDTGGLFSCHLVRITPGKAIGNHIHRNQLEIHEVIEGSGTCINNGTEIQYRYGKIAIIGQNLPHEVKAGEEGLKIFAKFIPALC